MPKRLHLFHFSLCLLVTGMHAQTPATAADQKPGYSQEAFVIEQNSTEVAFENDGTNVRNFKARVRIQSDAGVQRYAVLTFAYQSSTESLDLVYVRVRKPDNTVILTPLDNVQDLATEISREAPLFSDSREKHVAVKGLGVGDVLEYQARWHTTKPLATGQFWLSYNFPNDGIILEETLQVSFPRERLVKWKCPKSKPTTSETDTRRVLTWTSSHLERKSKEQEKKDQETALNQLGRGRVPQADVQLSSFQSWDEVGRWYGGLQLERVKPTAETRSKAAELTKGLADDSAKVRAIYSYVSSHIHYIGVDFGIGRYQPHAAGEVLGNQYGDCKDKHTLVAALLDAVGIQAFPALIGSLREVDEEVPSPAQFDHVISVVSLGGRMTWLDSTSEVGPFGYLLSKMRGKKALVVFPDKPAALILTPADPPLRPLQIFRIDAKLSNTGVLQGKVDRTLQGDDEEVLLRMALRRVPLPQWRDLIQRVSYAFGFAGEVSDVVASSPEKTDEPLHFSYNYLRKDYPDWSERRVGSPLPPLIFPPIPEKDAKPDSPIWLGSPMEVRLESRVELPNGYRPKLLKNLDVKESFGEYHRSYAINEGILTTQRRLITKLSEVPVTEFEAYIKFSKVVGEDNDRKIPVSSGTPSSGLYQDEIWDLPYSENADAARAYDDARDKYTKQDTPGEIASLRRALEIDPKFTRAQLWLGEIYKSLGQNEEAVQAYRKAISGDPQQAVGYKALGNTLLVMKKTEEALAVWRQLIKVAPEDSAGLESLGASLLSLKRYAEALPVLAALEQMTPESDNVHFQLGAALLHTDDREKALGEFRKALELFPQAPMYHNVARELAEANERLDVALEYAKKAVNEEYVASQRVNVSQLQMMDVVPTLMLSIYWDTLGLVYLKIGNVDEAEKYLNAAWTLSQSAEAADHLGQVYERQNKKQAAIHMYQLALAGVPPGLPWTSGPMGETRRRLERISPGAGKTDFRGNTELRSELSGMQMTKLALTVPGEANAEFFLTFGRDEKTLAVGVENVKFIRGSETLKSAESALRSASFKIPLPADGHPRLLRRGILSCYPYSGCYFILLKPTDVQSVE